MRSPEVSHAPRGAGRPCAPASARSRGRLAGFGRALASDLYRLARGRALAVSLAVLAVIIAAVTAFFWWGTSFEASSAVSVAEQGSQSLSPGVDVGLSATDEGVSLGVSSGAAAANPYHANDAGGVMQSRTYAYAGLLISGGFLPLFVSVVVVLLVCEDYDTGFAKGLLVGGRSRVARALAQAVLAALLSVGFLAVGIAVAEAGLAVAGFAYKFEDGALRWWAYVGLSALGVWCYASVSLLVAQLTRSRAAGVAASVLVSTGIAGSAASAGLLALSRAIPAAADVAAWLPSSCLSLMSGGAQALWSAGEVAGLAAPVHVLVVFGVVALLAAGLSLLPAALRDVA